MGIVPVDSAINPRGKVDGITGLERFSTHRVIGHIVTRMREPFVARTGIKKGILDLLTTPTMHDGDVIRCARECFNGNQLQWIAAGR